jgi:hypothetical protein
MVAEFPDRAQWREIVLDGVNYPVIGEPRVVDLGSFQRKITFGDFTRDSDDLLSSWIIGPDLTGGIGIKKRREGQHENRYWFGTLDTRSSVGVTLPQLVTKTTGPNTNGCRPLGDYPPGASGSEHFVAFGTNLSSYDEALARTNRGTLAAAPVSKRTALFKGSGTVRLWIPLGASGYDTWDGTSIAHGASPAAIAFAVWDNKLFALSTAGALAQTVDGTTWTTMVTLDGGQVPKSLIRYRTPSGLEALYVITDLDVWVYDAAIPALKVVDFQIPPHPDNNLSAAVHQGLLYLPASMEVYRFDAQTLSTMGPAQDHGVPAEFRGVITDLESTHSFMFALVKGATSGENEPEAWVADETMAYDDPIYFSQAQSQSTLLCWNGRGWHPQWIAPSPTGTPTWARLSYADNTYRLYWGYAGDLYSVDLRRTLHNPMEGRLAGVDRFAPSGVLDTGWFDADMPAFTKIASHLSATMEYATANERIDVSYMKDDDASFSPLGQLAATGEQALEFGDPLAIPSLGSEGLGFRRLWLRFSGVTSAAAQTPVLDSAVLKFIKVPDGLKTWTMTIPLMFTRTWKGKSAGELKALLDALIEDDRFFVFTHGAAHYRVRLAQQQGADRTGLDERGARQINLVEIPRE